MNTTSLGFSKVEAKEIIQDLNVLLANFQVYYQNLRGLHWNIKGKRFFDLHLKFEELYTDAQLKIDLVAERILTLEGTPLHTFEHYLAHNQLTIGENRFQDEAAIQLVLENVQDLLRLERPIVKKSAAIDDEGTNSMISDFILEQEKLIWMLKAWLA